VLAHELAGVQRGGRDLVGKQWKHWKLDPRIVGHKRPRNLSVSGSANGGLTDKTLKFYIPVMKFENQYGASTASSGGTKAPRLVCILQVAAVDLVNTSRQSLPQSSCLSTLSVSVCQAV